MRLGEKEKNTLNGNKYEPERSLPLAVSWSSRFCIAIEDPRLRIYVKEAVECLSDFRSTGDFTVLLLMFVASFCSSVENQNGDSRLKVQGTAIPFVIVLFQRNIFIKCLSFAAAAAAAMKQLTSNNTGW